MLKLFQVVALLFLSALSALAAPSRFTLASQSDWGTKRGFYIDFENDTAADGVAKLSTLKLIAGVADGKGWQYVFYAPTWTLGRTCHAQLKVDSPIIGGQGSDAGTAQFLVDDQDAGNLPTALGPQDVDLVGNAVPDWAKARAEYRVIQTQLEVDDARGKHVALLPASLGAATLFDGTTASTVPKWRPNGPFTVDVTFRLESAVDDGAYNPLVDRYGQPTFADYPEKVKADADLKDAADAEAQHEKAWGSGIPFDAYGGELHPARRGKATGYFHVDRHNGFNWLIDPIGAPCFYTGICTVSIPSGEATPVTGREPIFAWLPDPGGPFASALLTNEWGSDPGITFASFVDANLIRKYGDGWQSTATATEKRRARLWGFSGLGKWGAMWDDTPCIPVLGSYGVPNLVRHPDIFDPQVMAELKTSLANQITPHLTSPTVVGWSFGNEFDEVVTTDEIKQILQKPEGTPSRKAIVDYAVSNLYDGDEFRAAQIASASDADIEKMRQFYADRYYAAIHDTIKAIDPNHLFLGWWLVPNWWQNQSDWKLQAGHVDVLGIDYYNRSFDDPALQNWIKTSAKPILIGEFSFPPNYGMTRGFGDYQSSVTTPEEAGKLYVKWIDATASNPNVLGDCWFEMYDEGIAGRGPGHGSDVVYGEHFAFGLVDVADTPKWPLVDRVRHANLNAAALREHAAAGK